MSPEPKAPEGGALGTVPGSAKAGPSERPPALIRYIDQAEMVETFADSVVGLIFDGQTLRFEFGVTRFDEVKPDMPVTGRRYPACRLVLTPGAAVDLINRLQQITTTLTQAGIMKSTPRTAVNDGPKGA